MYVYIYIYEPNVWLRCLCGAVDESLGELGAVVPSTNQFRTQHCGNHCC